MSHFVSLLGIFLRFFSVFYFVFVSYFLPIAAESRQRVPPRGKGADIRPHPFPLLELPHPTCASAEQKRSRLVLALGERGEVFAFFGLVVAVIWVGIFCLTFPLRSRLRAIQEKQNRFVEESNACGDGILSPKRSPWEDGRKSKKGEELLTASASFPLLVAFFGYFLSLLTESDTPLLYYITIDRK
jgi:hypothetical protein